MNWTELNRMSPLSYIKLNPSPLIWFCLFLISLVPARQPAGGVPVAERSARADGELRFSLEPLAQREEECHADGAAVLQRSGEHVTKKKKRKSLPQFVDFRNVPFLFWIPELNPRRPPQAYLIFEGSEPLTFTNIFPCWERSLGAHTQVQTSSVWIHKIFCCWFWPSPDPCFIKYRLFFSFTTTWLNESITEYFIFLIFCWQESTVL